MPFVNMKVERNRYQAEVERLRGLLREVAAASHSRTLSTERIETVIRLDRDLWLRLREEFGI